MHPTMSRAKLSHTRGRDGCLTSLALQLCAKSAKGHCVKASDDKDAPVMGSGLGAVRRGGHAQCLIPHSVSFTTSSATSSNLQIEPGDEAARFIPARSLSLSPGAHKLLPLPRRVFADWRFFLRGHRERTLPTSSPTSL